MADLQDMRWVRAVIENNKNNKYAEKMLIIIITMVVVATGIMLAAICKVSPEKKKTEDEEQMEYLSQFNNKMKPRQAVPKRRGGKMIALKQIYRVSPVVKAEENSGFQSGKNPEPFHHISKTDSCEFKKLFDAELDRLQKEERK